jgi:hypothetical protein
LKTHGPKTDTLQHSLMIGESQALSTKFVHSDYQITRTMRLTCLVFDYPKIRHVCPVHAYALLSTYIYTKYFSCPNYGLGSICPIVFVSTGCISTFAGSSMILPSGPRGFLVQPVLKSGPSLKRGKGCASVLMTTSSSGRRSFGEKRR